MGQKKKPVIMVSTESFATPTTVTTIATRRMCVKPKVVNDYNRSMNRVDKLISTQSTTLSYERV